MPIIPISQVLNPDPEQATNDLIKLGQQAYQFSCQLYHEYPTWVLFDPLGAASPFASLRKSLWDSACKPSSAGLPAPFTPAPGYESGQCQVGYSVTTHVTLRKKADNSIVQDSDVTVSPSSAYLIGPVTGYSLDDPNNPSILYLDAHYELNPSQAEQFPLANWGPDTYLANYYQVSLVRTDGNPDTCGPQGYFPPSEPDLSTNLTLNFNDGTTTNVLATLVYDPVSVNVNASVNANLNWQVVLSPTFNFPGVNLTFDAFNMSVSLGDTVYNTNNLVLNLTGHDTSVPIFVPPYTNPFKSPNSYSSQPGPSGGSGQNKDASNLSFLVITLDQIPKNAKVMSGAGSPDIYFCGWVEFTSGLQTFPRQPIEYLVSIFQCPPGTDGYAYTLRFGYTCTVEEFTLKGSTK